MNKCILMAMATLLVGGQTFADNYVWIGGSSSGGDLNTPSKWDRGSCPGPNDTAVFQKGDETIVANDADVALLASVKTVKLASWAETYRAVLIFDVSTNTVMSSNLRGAGRFIKRGAGTLEFVSTDTTDAVSSYSSYGVYSVGGDGIIVEKGSLVLAQHNGFNYYYERLTVDDGASVVVSSNRTTVVGALNGAGTVSQQGVTERIFQIGKTGFADKPSRWRGSFSGKLTGKLSLDVRGNQDLLGDASDYAGEVNIYYGTGMSDYGWARFSSFGHPKGTPSAAGTSTSAVVLQFGAHVGYLGNGETTDRDFRFDAQYSGTGSAINERYFDAGPYGGLTINGAISLYPLGSKYLMRPFVLTGTNAAPCTMAGPFKLNGMVGGTNHNYYVRKEGSGTWNLKKNADSTFAGVFDVREGTLGFDSIAETNVLCALGFATWLSEEYTGDWNEAYRSRYALRAGAQAAGATAVLEFNGAETCKTTTRPLLLTGDAHFRANGTNGAVIDFTDVTAASAGAAEKTLVLDGTSTVANVMRDIANGDAVVSVVKDGSGTWQLDGNQTFTGDLVVRAGTLTVKGDPETPFRYFRVTFENNDPACAEYGGYVGEFGLYDKNGNRLNKGLAFQRPAGWVDDGGTCYTLPADLARTLEQNCMTFEKIPGYSTGVVPRIADGNTGALISLCDGVFNRVDFTYAFKYPAQEPHVATVSMRLADDSAEVAYVDFCQRYDTSGTKNANGFRLEGSVNGTDWTIVASTNSLPYKSDDYDCWYFSKSRKVNDYPDGRTLGDGEGMALTTRAIVPKPTQDLLAHVRSYSVATGAVLCAEGKGIPAIGKLVVDGDSGCGAIRGFAFADDIVIDVQTKGRPHKGTLPADFSGVTNFDAVHPTVTVNGEAGGKYRAKVGKNSVTIEGPGVLLIVQ